MSKQALIIDDNLLNVDVLIQLLNLEGVNAHSIPPTRDLQTRLQEFQSVDLIFLDLEMPHFDGYQLCQFIKGLPQFKSTPVVAYSVHVSEINVVNEQGFDGFLGKPINAEAFPLHLAKLLQGEKIWYIP